MAPGIPMWLEVLKAVAPIIAAVLAGAVALWFGIIQARISRRQADTAKNKLKLDLFDRRWAVYSVAIDSMRNAISNDGWSSDERFQYTVAVLGARWIMDETVNEYLTITIPQLIDAYQLACNDFKISTGPKRKESITRLTEAKNKLFSQLTEIDKIFEEHLKLES